MYAPAGRVIRRLGISLGIGVWENGQGVGRLQTPYTSHVYLYLSDISIHKVAKAAREAFSAA